MSLNSTRLLNQVILKGALPDGEFGDQEILDLAYDCLISEVQPLIVNLREEYFIKKAAFAVTAGQSYYRMPDRAVGQKLREVKLLRNGRRVDIPQISMEDANFEEQGQPNSFFLESNYVRLYPTPQATVDTLELYYHLRCSRLVPSTKVAVISAIDTVTGIATADCPASWSTAESFDLTSRKNAGENLAMDLTASSVSTTSITFTASDLPDELAIGDYISLAGESFIIQIPDEAVPLLVMLTVCECLGAMGTLSELQAAQAKAENLRAQLPKLLSSRVIGEPRRFSPMI